VEIDENNNKEPHPEEQELLAYMKDLFEEADYDSKGSKSFAAGMARTWALFLHDVSDLLISSCFCQRTTNHTTCIGVGLGRYTSHGSGSRTPGDGI
jgi:hypothetical protein